MPERNASPSTAPKKAGGLALLVDYLKTLGWALLLALIIRTFILQTFEIPSSSMEDTLEIGDYLVANKFLYGLRLPWSGERVLPIRAPRRGDVVIFKYPEDRSQDFIKRLIGEPGDEVMVRNKKVFVNGQPYENPHEVHKDPAMQPAGAGPRDNFGPVRVPEGSYFMMGDNRDNSYDSRYWGFVPQADIVGLAVVKYWSLVPGSWKVRWGNLGSIIS